MLLRQNHKILNVRYALKRHKLQLIFGVLLVLNMINNLIGSNRQNMRRRVNFTIKYEEISSYITYDAHLFHYENYTSDKNSHGTNKISIIVKKTYIALSRK